jgi:hypothetical protein
MLPAITGPRLVAVLLTVAWAGLAAALVPLYRAGGPLDLLAALSPLAPAVVAASAVRRRVPAPGPATARLASLIGVCALLLTGGFALVVCEALLESRSLITPSASTAFAGLAAAYATALSALLGKRDQRMAFVTAGGMTGVMAAVVGSVIFINGGSIPAATAVPTGCGIEPSGAQPSLTLRARSEIDGVEQAVLDSDDPDIGRRLRVLIGDDRASTEEIGLENLAGTPARHCRRPIDGRLALGALPELVRLIDDSVDIGPARLSVWRGGLDWWIVAGGSLGRAELLIGGHPADAWPVAGLRGAIRAVVQADSLRAGISRQPLP